MGSRRDVWIHAGSVNYPGSAEASTKIDCHLTAVWPVRGEHAHAGQAVGSRPNPRGGVAFASRVTSAAPLRHLRGLQPNGGDTLEMLDAIGVKVEVTVIPRKSQRELLLDIQIAPPKELAKA